MKAAEPRDRCAGLNGNPAMTEAELRLLQGLIYQECGLVFDERRAHFLQERLQRRLRACGIVTFYQYYRLLTSRGGRGELTELLELLTVNETSFFRNKPQLDLFQKIILDELLHRKHAQRDYTLRLWSAGCSTGQEPFTLAMLVADALSYYLLRYPEMSGAPAPQALIPSPWQLEIVGSDISQSALRSAQEASFSDSQMEGVDCMYRLRFFERAGELYALKKPVRDLVRFEFHNLKSESLPRNNDVIFCRNVMIYFDEPEQKRLVDKLFHCLNPCGYLFLGHAESLFGVSRRFRLIHHNHGTAYQRVEGVAP